MEREAAEVYMAVRPDGREPAWKADIPELRPTLRPYQNRALHWMVQRERAQVRAALGSILMLHSSDAEPLALRSALPSAGLLLRIDSFTGWSSIVLTLSVLQGRRTHTLHPTPSHPRLLDQCSG